MLQSVLSAILLYHIIKALVRSAKKQKTSASTENRPAATNTTTPYAAAKPQPATNAQKKREKQFQQL